MSREDASCSLALAVFRAMGLYTVSKDGQGCIGRYLALPSVLPENNHLQDPVLISGPGIVISILWCCDCELLLKPSFAADLSNLKCYLL